MRPGLATARAAGERWLRARNALVEALRGFVVTLARRDPAWHVPLEDRIQAGALAVVVALERFDPARGTRLTTYLGPVVERAMRRLGRRTPRHAAPGSPGLLPACGRAVAVGTGGSRGRAFSGRTPAVAARAHPGHARWSR